MLKMTMILLPSLIVGCAKPSEPVVTAALFCDVEEPRRFTQAEIDWRAANAPWNLRKDYKTNLTHERECADVVD